MKVRVKEDASVAELYGLKVGDVVTTCAAPDSWGEDSSVWFARKDNPHVEYTEDWEFCEVFCIATESGRLELDFEVVCEGEE